MQDKREPLTPQAEWSSSADGLHETFKCCGSRVPIQLVLQLLFTVLFGFGARPGPPAATHSPLATPLRRPKRLWRKRNFCLQSLDESCTAPQPHIPTGYCTLVWVLWFIYGDNRCETPLGMWLFYTGIIGITLQAATVVVNVHQARTASLAGNAQERPASGLLRWQAVKQRRRESGDRKPGEATPLSSSEAHDVMNAARWPKHRLETHAKHRLETYPSPDGTLLTVT